MSAERRQFVRLPAKLSATYTLIDPKANPLEDASPALTANVGGGGVCLATPVQFAPGTVLEVEIKFPDRPAPVRFRGQVVWCSPTAQAENARPSRYETGLSFISVSAEDQKFMRQHAAMYATPEDKGG